MPDLGAYAGAVLSAYAVSAALLGGLTLRSLIRNARARGALAQAEKRHGRDG